MILQSFRIQNFKSIIDTGWCNLSIDNITGLVGQNESGKSSILEALYAFGTGFIVETALRSDETLPRISCSFKISSEEFQNIFKDHLNDFPNGSAELFETLGWRINLVSEWSSKSERQILLEEKQLINQLSGKPRRVVTSPAIPKTGGVHDPLDVLKNVINTIDVPTITASQFVEIFQRHLPHFELFEENKSLLPDRIDIDDLINENRSAEGYSAVVNFLTIANVDIQNLKAKAPAPRRKTLQESNNKITANFRDFWQQQIGNSDKIQLSFEIENYDETHEKRGKAYLDFWVQDGNEPLHPKQRSQGVRWFLSFYLQLQASKLRNPSNGYVMLIDEPGQSLHARAQEDVLKVFDDIRLNFHVIYTTHSPYLVSLENLHRLIAVQRSENVENSPTELISALHLGSASSDTLTPILTNMGVNLNHQNILTRRNNLVLEEPSAYFYISAFVLLLNRTKGFSFLPATGVDKVPLLVNLLTGWGIDYTVVLDNDPAGEKVRKDLLKNIYAGDENLTVEKVILLPEGCHGIEDLFTIEDFCKIVLNGELHSEESNSKFMRVNKISKPVCAAKFKQAIVTGTVQLSSFSKESLDKIIGLLEELEKRYKEDAKTEVIRKKIANQ